MDKSDLDLSALDPGGAGYFEFLSEDVLRGLEGGPSSDLAADGAASSVGLKRERDAEDCQSDDGPEPSGSGTGKASRAESDGKYCRSKACREKARREKINDRFQELAKLCDPDDPKTDKASILAESIKIVTQLRVEKGQLRQLNKLLEERVRNYEKERSQSLYQQSLMLQGRFQPIVQHVAPQPAMHCPQPGFQVALGMPAQGLVGTSTDGTLSMSGVGSSVDGPSSSSAQCMGPVVGTPVPCPVAPAQTPVNASLQGTPNFTGPVGWMSLADTTQDHLLRPPAA